MKTKEIREMSGSDLCKAGDQPRWRRDNIRRFRGKGFAEVRLRVTPQKTVGRSWSIKKGVNIKLKFHVGDTVKIAQTRPLSKDKCRVARK